MGTLHVLDHPLIQHKLAILRAGRLIEAGPTAEIVGKSNLEEVFLQLEREEGTQ